MPSDETTNLPPLPPPKYGSLNYQRGGLPTSAKESKPKENKLKEPVVASLPTKPQRPAKTQTTPQPKKPLVLDNQKVQYQPAAGFSRLGRDMYTGDYVDVPQASRRQGLYIIGANGTGKTGLIEHLILQDINQGLGVGLLDPHGDLTNAILAKMTKREEDVILLDIQDEDHPFGLNMFACPNPQSNTAVQKIVDLVMHIFEKLYDVSRQTPRMAQYLRNCTYTLVANPGYTMADIPLLLTDEDCRHHLLAKVTDSKVRLFWHTYDAMRPAEQREHAESTLNKLDEFLSPLVINIVGQAQTTVNIQHVMDERKILLVKLSAQLDQVTSLIGSAIIAMVLNAAYARASIPIEKRKQFNLYADEFQRFATEDFATLLTEARKFGIATTIAHQARYQPGMTDGIRAVSLQAANYVMFRVTSPDADELAGSFNISPQEAWEEELEEEWVEVLKEEWHERVEEEITDGEEAILIPKQDVISHLMQHGHSNEEITEFVTGYLNKLWQASEASLVHAEELDYRYQRRQTLEWPTNEFDDQILKTEYAYNPQEVKKTLSTLNHLLALYNAHSTRPSTFDQLQALEQEVCTGFAKVLGYYHYNKVHTTPQTQESKQALARLHALRKESFALTTGGLQGEEFSKVYRRIREEQKQCEVILKQEGIKLITDTLQAQLSERNSTFKRTLSSNLWFAIDYERAFYLPYRFTQDDILLDATSIYQWEADRFVLFHGSLVGTSGLLIGQPILTESGGYKPRTRTQVTYLTHPRETITHPRVAITHPQRTYQDVKNDIANQLSSMPDFTARARITIEGQTVEHTIKTLKPEKGLFGNPLHERIAGIQSRNRNPQYGGFCRQRKDVEAEILQRQHTFQPLPFSPQKHQSQQQTRHARQVPLQVKCPNCGKSNPTESKFCNQCGTQL